ncbi:MAG: multidrug efflux SMR transporter [Hyphomicrobiales bacterium]|nr:multidrug efflux SMR transporter [Hyphomicrobiales bacterium]
MAYAYLSIAIVLEVIATGALKSADGFTKVVPSMVVLVGYGAAFWLLSICLKTLEVGFTYAVWSGVGIALVATIGVIFYGETVDLPAIIGFTLIIAGVAVLGFFSDASLH